MGNIVISILSVIISFLLCIYAFITHQLWITWIMIIVGILGVLFLANLRGKGKLDKFASKFKID